MRQSIIAGVNYILGTYCKGAVHEKGDKILAGTALNALGVRAYMCVTADKKSGQNYPVLHLK